MEIIIVGVDGSQGAESALEFAVEEAKRRNGAVRVICVCGTLPFWSARTSWTAWRRA